MNKLKPCPFCGGKVRMDRTTACYPIVECLNDKCCASMYGRGTISCRIKIGQSKCEQELTEQWNCRAKEKK
jgi:hypothetical protein